MQVWSDLSRSPPRVDRANRHSAQVKMIAGQLEQAGFEDEVRVLSKFRHPNVPSRLRMMGTVRRAVPGPVYLYTANGIFSSFKTSRRVESEI